MSINNGRAITMTFAQLTELIRHIEEEHNFFNRQSGQRIVKSITPHIDLRRAGTISSVDMIGYGWERSFSNNTEGHGILTSMFTAIMMFLDNPEEEYQSPF